MRGFPFRVPQKGAGAGVVVLNCSQRRQFDIESRSIERRMAQALCMDGPSPDCCGTSSFALVNSFLFLVPHVRTAATGTGVQVSVMSDVPWCSWGGFLVVETSFQLHDAPGKTSRQGQTNDSVLFLIYVSQQTNNCSC